jgi:hypothetical protein
MVEDGILEDLYSDYVSPLTLVHRENKPVRICVDARDVNMHMTPDKVKVAPMGELLQRFYCSRYITTLDLSSAVHQVMLAGSSRKWTAFNFENQLCTSLPESHMDTRTHCWRLLELYKSCWVMRKM